MVTVAIDAGSSIPPSAQLRSQLEELIHGGSLPGGTRLPTVRQLANDLGLAPNTVARAYQALETSGLVRGAGRRGTIVTDTATRSASHRELLVQQAADELWATVQRLGGGPTEARQAVDRAIGRSGG